jgi:hypothetical protein
MMPSMNRTSGLRSVRAEKFCSASTSGSPALVSARIPGFPFPNLDTQPVIAEEEPAKGAADDGDSQQRTETVGKGGQDDKSQRDDEGCRGPKQLLRPEVQRGFVDSGLAKPA